MAEPEMIPEEPEPHAIPEQTDTSLQNEGSQEVGAEEQPQGGESATGAAQEPQEGTGISLAEDTILEQPEAEGEAAAQQAAEQAAEEAAQQGESTSQEAQEQSAADGDQAAEGQPGATEGQGTEPAQEAQLSGEQAAQGESAEPGEQAAEASEQPAAEEGQAAEEKKPDDQTGEAVTEAAADNATGETLGGEEVQMDDETGVPKTPVSEVLSRGNSPKPVGESPPMLDPDDFDGGEKRKLRGAARRVGGYSFGGISEDDEMMFEDDEDDEEAMEHAAKKTKEQEEAEAATAAAERQKQQRDALMDEFHRIQQHREQIQSYNNQLQHKLADYFRKKRNEEAGRGIEFEKPSAEQEQRYVKYMATIEELRAEIVEQQSRYAEEIALLKQKAEEQHRIIDQEFQLFQQRQKEVGLKSVSQQTGRLMDEAQLDQELAILAKKEHEVTTMRLDNIKMKNRLLKQEEELRSHDEIGEGLHMIDFEQLKIENQTYNEKIEERNEELAKLRKKITNTVQIMTHLKEKIQFLQNENERLRANLAAVDAQVANSRDNLARTKHVRDSLRFENQRLRTSCGLLGHEELLRDFEIVVDTHGDQREKLEKMKMEHTELSMLTTGLRRKIEQVNAGGAGSSKGIVLPTLKIGQSSTVASQPSLFPH